MENLEKVVIGLVLFAVTSIIAYLFRMRQLYVVVPKLFRHAQISKEGSLCELLVYNKGNQAEEGICVLPVIQMPNPLVERTCAKSRGAPVTFTF